MSNAQPTGWLFPQMPIPFASSQIDREQQQLRDHKRDPKTDKPVERRLLLQRNVADLVGDACAKSWSPSTIGG